MKLATYERDGRQSFGVLTDKGIFDVPAAWPSGPRSVLETLQAGPQAMQSLAALLGKAASFVSPTAVRLLAPVLNPAKVIGLAGNYAMHIKESGKALGLSSAPKKDTTPRPFLMPATTITGPGAEIAWPGYSKEIDYEIELAIVIGKPAKCLTPAQAADVIAGYTIANDVSARSVTFAEGRSKRPWDEFYDWLHGKWADGFCPIGPCLVTADEIADVRNLNLQLSVNGEVRQQANTGEMIFDVFETVSFISQIMTLLPGDIIATGTPAGVAMASGKWLKGGDVITCRIDGLGELTNTLGQPPKSFHTPCKQ